jgi:hypothetical protein
MLGGRQGLVVMPWLRAMNDGGCSLVLLVFCLMHVGGYPSLVDHASAAINK